eukprot:4562073-Alexandrium_andersonii.AAC.1
MSASASELLRVSTGSAPAHRSVLYHVSTCGHACPALGNPITNHDANRCQLTCAMVHLKTGPEGPMQAHLVRQSKARCNPLAMLTSSTVRSG